jgi:hypothetical protein
MRRWEDNIKMDLKKAELKYVYWIHMAQVGSSGGLL